MEGKRRVLIFSTQYFPHVGGAEIAVKEITDRLLDYDFDMITAKGTGNLADFERIGNVSVCRVGMGSRYDKYLLPVLGFFAARRLSARNSYSFIWSIMASYAGLAASLFRVVSGIKMVLTVQEGDDEEHLKRFVFNNDLLYKIIVRPIHRFVFKTADKITAISQDLARRASRSGARAIPQVIPNGVDIGKFRKREAADHETKKRLGIKEGDKVVISVSRLAKKNGMPDLVKAFKKVCEKMPQVKLVICGAGEEESELRKTAVNLGLGQRVIFAGLVKHSELPPYLWLSDCFVRPSLSEGLGNVFLEAMAAEVPVIGTPVGGIPDFLVDKETGLFCEPGNPADIAEKIMLILADRDLAGRLKNNGLNLVRERFEWDLIAEKMRMVFES